MKTNAPTLNIVLLAKPDRKGLHPIVLRAHWQGVMAEKRTGVSIPSNVWNKRTSTIKSTYPNSKELNKIIQDTYSMALSRKLELEGSELPFVINEIFQDKVISNKLDIEWLVEQMVKDRNLSITTTHTLRYTVSKLKQYIPQHPILLTKLDSDCIQAWGRYLSDEGLKNSTIINYMYSVCNIWNYAISKKYVAASLNPFLFFNPRKVYKSEIKKKAITKDEYSLIRKVLEQAINKHQNLSVFSDTHSDEFALAMYILGYTFGGLAFADMAELKKDQIITKEVEGKPCYIFNNVRRKKTNHPVPIMVTKDGFIEKLIEYYMSTPGEYLFPIYNVTPFNFNDESKALDLARVGRYVNNGLRRVTGLDITYYSCRHSFATHYVTTPGSSPVYLASMMGRSVNGIWRYVQDIYSNEELIRERSRMGL